MPVLNLPALLIAAVLLAGAAWPGSPRAFQVVVLAAMLAALWEAGSRLARWLAPDLPWESHAVAAFSLAVGIAVVPATWMGQLGWLRPAPFPVWTAVAFLLSYLLLPRPDAEAEPAPASIPASKGARADTALLIMAALAVALVGLYAGLALSRRPRPGLAVVTGAALGLLLATKYIGVLFVPPVLAVLALAAWIERRRREPAERPRWRALAGIALALVLAMAISGGYTYLRNAVTT